MEKKEEEKSLILPGKIKNEKDWNEDENPIVLALLIAQEAIISV